ncbi:MAG: L-fucose:H+ symporter permease [Verrucomicrobiota bacterium]|jgi:FHS family L-fucose permease-like MFS transporter
MHPPENQAGKPSFLLPVILVTSLFFCWGLTTNLLPVLIPKLKAACELTNSQSMLVDVANWSAYFLMAMPAALVMRRFGYKAGILAGLLVAASGCFLFVPAANVCQFPFFLSALFITAAGMVFLETAANPYISVLGRPDRAAFRLNLSQSFNGLAAVVAALWLSKVIIKPENPAAILALLPADKQAEIQAALALMPKHDQLDFLMKKLATLAPEAHRLYLLEQAKMVIPPYVAIGIFLALVAVLFFLVKLPEVTPEDDHPAEREKFVIKQHPLLFAGIVAQFFYVGAQVGLDATFLSYTKEVTGLSLADATTYLGLILGCFFIGRVVGTALMAKIPPARLLGGYALGIIALVAACASIKIDPGAATTALRMPSWLGLGEELVFTSHLAPYLLMGVKFFMSIMYPTIFSLSLQGLGVHTKLASSFLVMSIIGGALIPYGMGQIADHSSFQNSYWILALCMLPVLYFAFRVEQDRRT